MMPERWARMAARRTELGGKDHRRNERYYVCYFDFAETVYGNTKCSVEYLETVVRQVGNGKRSVRLVISALEMLYGTQSIGIERGFSVC